MLKRWWCEQMHSKYWMWPVAGRIRCRKCWLVHPVVSEQKKKPEPPRIGREAEAVR
jgi:hypothetical protein